MAKVQNRERLLRKLAAMPPRVKTEVGKALREGGAEIANLQRRLAPKESGDLVRSIKVVSGDYMPDNANVRGVGGGGRGDPDLTVRVVAGDAKAFYAAWVEHGTAPHLIKPKKKGGMLTLRGGDVVPQVQHPGARAQPFFFSAYRALRKRVRARVSRATTKAVKAIATQ